MSLASDSGVHPTVSSNTFAGIIAALYGDPDDLEFAASKPWVPTLAELEESFHVACDAGNLGAATLLAEELCRLRGGRVDFTTRGLCYGSKAGLWRVQ